ncbi:MAG: FMN-binding protein [Fidelibacterota bacterium]
MKIKQLLMLGLMVLTTVTLSNCKLNEYKEKVANTEIHEVDLSQVDDGTYEGFYDCYMVKAKVNVTVSDHKITDIVIVEHDNGRGEEGEKVVPKVMEKQSLKVDTISGATASSKIILKAIELALTGEK